jgi:RNA polymerase sigma-54 factor
LTANREEKGMQLSVGVKMTPELGMAATPALVAYATMLALPGAELEQAVARELSENPALVQEEVDTCGGCGLPGVKPCLYCGREAGRFRVPGSRDARDPSSGAGPVVGVTWADALLTDLRLALPARYAKIAALVVASLDDRGYLTEEIPDLARMADTDAALAEHVVATLRETGPPGVGARDLRDCLLIQIDRRAAQGITHPLARTIVADHLDALARGATGTIARRLGVAEAEVTIAGGFIRRELHPRPDLHEGSAQDDRAAVGIQPDVAVVRPPDRERGFRVDVLEELRIVLHVDPLHRQVARADDQVAEWVKRGDFFLARLRERWSTIRRITEYLLERQPGLVAGEPSTDRHVTRAAAAVDLGLNPSTVSRATAGKYVMLPSRRVLPFAAFFDGSRAVCASLEAILASEERPLTDSELCARLERAGHSVARRTVAKYRSRLHVLPSAYR